MTNFSFYRDGLRVEPRWPDGQKLTDTGMNVGGVSPKRIVTDESGFMWMLKFEGADTDVATSKMANALRLPQPFVKYFDDVHYDKFGKKQAARAGSIQEWLDEAVTVRDFTKKNGNTAKVTVQRAFHSLLTYLTGDCDRHDQNEIVWYDDVFAIDRSRALGYRGFWYGTVSIGSAVMNATTPDSFDKFLNRLDAIDTADWVGMLGAASVGGADKQVAERKRNIRKAMSESALYSIARVYGENKSAWETFIRLNG
jgi:hypothetical protein